jgi:hypothetical protein
VINYLQTITVFGLSTGLQKAAARDQKTHAIQTDDNETFSVESIRSLKEIERSTATDEDRTEERKHGIRTPQSEEDYLQATYNHNMLQYPVPAANLSKLLSFHHLSGVVLDVFV